MKARTVRTAPRYAEHIFTDREEPRRSFWNAYHRVSADPGSVEAVSYYGIGGIGKTSLLVQLVKELRERANASPGVYYSFELSGKGKDDCLYFLAESLMQQCPGLRFPLFGAALLRLNQMAGRDASDLERRMEHSLLNRPGVTAALDVMSAFLPSFNSARAAGMAGLLLFKTLKKQHEQASGEFAHLYREIEESSAAELLNNLQNYFAIDAAPWLETQAPPAVFLLDGYEVLANTLDNGDLAEVSDTWLWGRDGLIWSLPNTLWVIAGRNRLAWDRHDSELGDSLEQHLLGDLSEEDTIGFLRQSGVEGEELLRDLYALTGGTPVYLDLCVNTYRQLREVRGGGYQPVASDFGSSPVSLAEQFLRGMNSEHQRMIKLIACLPANWTDELALDAAAAAGYPAARGPFEDIRKLSLVEKAGNSSKLHSTLRTVVRKFMAEDERIRLDNAVFRLLLNKTDGPASKAEGEYSAVQAAELLSRPDTGITAGEDDLRTLLDGIKTCCDMGKYRTYYECVEQVTAYAQKNLSTPSVSAMCLDHRFEALLNLGHYREAAAAGQEAVSLRTSLNGTNHPDTLFSLNNLAIGYNKLGDWQKALELTKTVYEGRLAIYGEDHESTVACTNNMAIYSVMLGDYEGAAAMMESSFAAMKRLLGPDHPRTVVCMNNLAAVYARLKQHRRSAQLLQQVYEIQLRTLGEDHPDLLFSLFNLSIAHSNVGEHRQALELAEKAYDAHLRILGESHPDTFAALNNLGECHLNLGHCDTARPLIAAALEGRRSHLGEDHPDTKESLELLAKCDSQ